MPSPDDYEYRGLLAASWDLLRGDPSIFPDRDFYRDIILDSGEPVLDVGCGTGRLLIEYLADGLDVDGVDASPEMIALCRRKIAEQNLTTGLYTQPMEHLNLPRRYWTIFVPRPRSSWSPMNGTPRRPSSNFPPPRAGRDAGHVHHDNGFCFGRLDQGRRTGQT